MQYYPNNFQAMVIQHNQALQEFWYKAKLAGSPPKEEMLKIPHLKALFDKVSSLEIQLDKIGYAEMPPAAYKDWLEGAADMGKN